MKKFIISMILFSFTLISSTIPLVGAQLKELDQIQQWDVFEIQLEGIQKGNPFIDVKLLAEFKNRDKIVTAKGFYDGNGNYKIRFMPDQLGEWSYVTTSNQANLDGVAGSFTCVPALENNHGPVRVADKFHFAYADGKQFFPVGTTLYCWHLERYKETLETLKNSGINKIRFMPFPHSGNKFPPFHPWQGSVNNWDFDKPNPEFWRFIENAVKDLREIGVQADLIFFHPYESGNRRTWGFGPEQMTAMQCMNYLKYVVSRLAAFNNVWWSMANEYNLINESESYWEPLAKTVAEADPYDHMHSIHGTPNFVYPGWDNSWVTHISMQSPNVDSINEWRARYQKPVIDDEYQYEGNISGWGNLSGKEETRRHWIATIEGGYATHGESFSPYNFFWKGGAPQKESFSRVSWLSEEVLNNNEKPLPGGLDPVDSISAQVNQDYYLFYYGDQTSNGDTFHMPKGIQYRLDVLNTWDMTVTEMEGVYSNTFSINWPSDQYIAVRIFKIIN